MIQYMKVEKMLESRFFRFIIPGIIFFIVWLIYRENFSDLNSTVNSLNCKTKEKILSMNIQGVISSKYNDKRGLRYFMYYNGKDTLACDIFVVEASDFYEYLNLGDSISKGVGSLDFKVNRMVKDSIHVLNYECE